MAALCDVVMRSFSRLAARAGSDSPFAVARARLGARFEEVAAASLRKHTLAVLTGEGAAEALARMDAAGEAGAKLVIVDVVGAAIREIIDEAAEVDA